MLMTSYAGSAIQPTVAASGRSTPNVTARNLLAIVVFALTFHAPALHGDDAPPAAGVKVNPADLPRFHQVHSYFWRGAAPSYAGIDRLKQLGVKTVIDLRRSEDRIAAERQYVEAQGIKYVSLPMGNFIPSLQKQQTFLQIMQNASETTADAPVFLHCSHGSDRTGYLTALWRVQHDHWSILEACAEMFQYGFLVHKLSPNERVDQ